MLWVSPRKGLRCKETKTEEHTLTDFYGKKIPNNFRSLDKCRSVEMEILKVVKFKRCHGRGRKKKLLVVVQMKEYQFISLV